MPLGLQELDVGKVIVLDSQIPAALKLNKSQVLTALKTYRVLYNRSEVDLWIEGIVYKF